ncbi:MAG TPA: hypothetical protein RMH99_24390 [Sandaracinaceae bacterium LLY-WYZ-13_1]|nr:hypothetical protein [Sandaracinaceae bacterium LLY-WYZ-13_1]
MRPALWLTLALVPITGCDAIYEDLRPSGGPADAGPVAADARTVPDDGDASLAPTSLARGRWEGRTGYSASGGVTLERDPDGSVHLRFEDDFDSQAVPGPVVVLSPRAELGTAIEPAAGDRQLGELERASGPQRYAVPAGAEDAAYAWVYCLPFGVEVARASLAPVEAP